MNNKIFAKTIEYGDLFFDEIFLYYDGPCIFSITNILGHRFICLLETEAKDFDRYIIAPVSFTRYRDFVQNRISIRHIFTKSEDGNVFTLNVSKSEISSVNIVSEKDFNYMNLPEETEFLDIKESYTNDELILNSEENNRGIAQFIYEKNSLHQHSIKAKELSQITIRLQKVIDGIVKDWGNNNNLASKQEIDGIKRNSQLSITRTFPGSFGLQIESDEYRDLCGESFFDMIMERFAKISVFGKDEKDEFFKNNIQSFSALRDYYKILMINKFSIKFKTTTPRKKMINQIMSMDDIKNRYNYLNAIIENKVEQINISGFILAFDLINRTFKIRSINDKEISGKLDQDFNETIFETDKQVKFLLNKNVELEQVGSEKEKYTLLSIIEE